MLVVRTAAEQLSPSSAATALSACRTLLGAGTAADVLAAAQSWAVPVNDLVAADTTGRCVHAVIGAAARPLPERLRTVFVVDGKRRMDSRIFVEDDHGESGVGAFGAYVVGAVNLCPHGSRQAELMDVRAQRLLAHAPGLRLDPHMLETIPPLQDLKASGRTV